MKTTSLTRNLTLARKVSLTGIAALILSIAPVLSALPAHAAQIATRSITISSSAPSATGVTYSLATSALPTATAVKSLRIQFCTTSSGACTAPAGFSASASTLPSQPTGLGATTGWTVNTTVANELRIVNAANSTAPSGNVTVGWGNVTNPSATNTTFYGIITTYSDATWTTPLDSAGTALSTSTQIQVSMTVNETLTFCTGTTITGQNCGTIAGNLVNLGTGSTTGPSSGTSVMAASTNGASGYTITVSGSTLTSGANTITALTSPTASTTGTKQFGLNLVNNTTPTVGAAVSGGGTGTASTGYNTTNNYKYVAGETVAAATGPTNANTYTVSYLANIDGLTPPGAYNTTLTYVATANF